MFIDFYAEIWRATAQDDARPSLAHVLIADSVYADKYNLRLPADHNGVAVATDGFMLAIVPVILEDDDVPGLVDPELIKQAAKMTPKTFPGAWLSLGDRTVKLIDRSERPRYRYDTDPGNFPDIVGVVPTERPKGDDKDGLYRHPVLSINTAYLIDLTRAMGARYIKSERDNTHYRFVYLAGTFGTPILIERARHVGNFGASWVTPLGLLMPITDTDAQDGYYERGRPRAKGFW